MSALPKRGQDLYDYVVKFSGMLTAAPTLYGLTAGDATAVSNVVNPYAAAFLLNNDKATKSQLTVAAKNFAQDEMLPVVRYYADRISTNPAVDPVNKLAIGVRVPNTSRVAIKAPTAIPEVAFVSAIPGVQTFTAKQLGVTGNALPYGSVGILVLRTLTTEATTDYTKAEIVTTVSSSTFTLSYLPTEKGLIVTLFFCYVTQSGPNHKPQRGPVTDGLPLTVM